MQITHPLSSSSLLIHAPEPIFRRRREHFSLWTSSDGIGTRWLRKYSLGTVFLDWSPEAVVANTSDYNNVYQKRILDRCTHLRSSGVSSRPVCTYR